MGRHAVSLVPPAQNPVSRMGRMSQSIGPAGDRAQSRRYALIHENPVPVFENQQRPDLLVPAHSSRFVVHDNPLEDATVQIIPAGGVRTQEGLPCKTLQVVAKPGIRGYRETLFDAPSYRFR